MSSLSRRNFLHAGGAAAAGAVVLAGPLSHAAAAGKAQARNEPAEVLEPEGVDHMVMYVKNTGKGEVAIMTAGQEVVFHDPELVARVQRAAKRSANTSNTTRTAR
jgi:hypothetical protein